MGYIPQNCVDSTEKIKYFNNQTRIKTKINLGILSTLSKLKLTVKKFKRINISCHY